MAEEVFKHRESNLAKQIGVSADTLREWRRMGLGEGIHFARVGTAVLYSGEALALTVEHFQLRMEELKKTPAALVAVFVRLPKNPRVFYATLDGEQIRVMIRRPRKFARGQAVLVEHVESDLYRFLAVQPEGDTP